MVEVLRFFPDYAGKKWFADGEQHSLHTNSGPGSRAGDGVDSVGLPTIAPGATAGGHGVTAAATQTNYSFRMIANLQHVVVNL